MAESDEVSGFEIDGRTYPIPVVATFDMDEAEILWGYCEVGLEDLVPDDDGLWSDEHNQAVLKIMKNPSFRRTLLHVAYRRDNPDATREQIDKVVGKSSNVQAMAAWWKQVASADDPPQGLMRTPDGSSPSETDGSSTSSGNGSSTTSEKEPDGRPAHIGATR